MTKIFQVEFSQKGVEEVWYVRANDFKEAKKEAQKESRKINLDKSYHCRIGVCYPETY